MKKPTRRRPRRSLRNTGARPVVLHCSHPGCKRTWDFFSSKSPYAEKSITPEMTEWLNDGGALVMSRDDGWGVAFDNKSICDVHNRRLGGFESYTVKCGHPRCHETFKHSFYRPLSDAEGASYSASIEAISQGGWGMSAGKSLRCPAHARVEKSVIIRGAIAKDQPSSDQVFFESGAHIGVPSEYFSTVRAIRGKRVKITITIDE